MSLNKVMLIGNVGKDPDVRYLESNPSNPGANAKVASFPLATSERYRDRNGELRENTEWHNIVVWRGNADVVEKFVRKGTQLYIVGRLRTRQWTDQTGNKRYTTEVVADTLQLLGKRPDGQAEGQPGYGSGSGQQGYQGGYAQQPARPAASAYQGPGYGPASPAPAAGPSAPAASPAAAPQAGGSPVVGSPVVGSPVVGPQSGGSPDDGSPVGGSPAGALQGPTANPAQPVNPAYQGPLPAAEPTDDLPF